MMAGSRGLAWAAPRLAGRTLSQPLTALLGTLGPDHPETRQEPPCFFPVHEVPHLVDLHDVVRGSGRRRRGALAGRADPFVDRDMAHPEQPGDHSLAGIAQ